MKAIVVIESQIAEVKWMADVAVNYSQLSFDFSQLSRINAPDYDFYTVSDVSDIYQLTQYEYVIVIEAGTMLGYTYFERQIAKQITRESEYYRWPNNTTAFVWCPPGDGESVLNTGYTLPVVDPSTPDTFSLTHDRAIEMLISQSNISYIIHNEIPDPQPSTQPLQWAMTMSSGFYINYILHNTGFTTDCEIHHVDISRLSLKVRKYTIDNWDGINYYNWMDHLYQKFPLLEAYNGPDRFHSHDPAARECWQHVITTFSEEGWQEHWKKYTQLKHHYHNCNLGDNTKFAQIINSKHSPTDKVSAFWWNGALKRLPANLLKTSAQSTQMARQFLNTLKTANPELLAYGSDHCGTEFNGCTVTEAHTQCKDSRKILWKQV